jgi:hypothetical protein
MVTGIILGVAFVAIIIFGSGKSRRRRELDELGLGADTPSSGEQMHDANSFEQTNRPD